MRRVLFVNENVLGHRSYLLPYFDSLQRNPDWGIEPVWIDANPLPPNYDWRANFSVRGLRKFGLDFSVARYRWFASSYVLDQVHEIERGGRLDGIFVNTQSVGLRLIEHARQMPVLVGLDATFRQMGREAWFAPNRVSRALTPLTLAPVLSKELRLFQAARKVLSWSQPVRESLIKEYSLPEKQIEILPPSLPLDRYPMVNRNNRRPQLLFVGGDFRRKGGPILLESFNKYFASTCDLHILTQTPLNEAPHVHIYSNIKAHTPEWYSLWQNADIFVFPSHLETFGMVTVEAIAFGAAVIASRVGAAEFALDNGRAGILLSEVSVESIRSAIEAVLDNPDATKQRILHGRKMAENHFDLARNSRRVAEMFSF